MSSLSDTQREGALPTIAERFADADEARMRELDRLIAKGLGSTMPRDIPPEDRAGSPVSPTKENVMSKGKPKECCGSMGTRHLATCAEAGRKATPAPTKTRTPRVRLGAADEEKVAALSLDDLLELRDRIDAELKRRKDAAEAELAKLNEALAA